MADMNSACSPPPAASPRRSPPRAFGADTLLSIIIPCYNEQDVLPLLQEHLSAGADDWNLNYEIILVDDGSTDQTWALMQAIHTSDPRWKMLRLSRNFGQQTALWAGFHAARGDLVAVLDADLQDPPELLPQFFQKWTEGYDVIYGVRQKRKEGILKRTAYTAYYRILARLSDISVPLDSGDYCVMDRRVVDVLKTMPERNRFIRGLRAWVGFKQFALPYERQERAAGDAKYTLSKLIRLAVDGLVSFSTCPLRVATYLGICISSVSLVIAALAAFQRIFADWFAEIGLAPMPGFAMIVASVFFVGGIQLLCMGILGEYLGRVYEDVRQRPMWTCMDALGIDDPLATRTSDRDSSESAGDRLAPSPPGSGRASAYLAETSPLA
jgi:dolichol-phosphate mannosyltransferase